MLRKAGMPEKDMRYYSTTHMNSWVRLLSSLCILTNEAIDVKLELENFNSRLYR